MGEKSRISGAGGDSGENIILKTNFYLNTKCGKSKFLQKKMIFLDSRSKLENFTWKIFLIGKYGEKEGILIFFNFLMK